MRRIESFLNSLAAILFVVGLVIVVSAILLLVFAIPITFLWNWLLVPLGLPALKLWQAVGIITLLSLLRKAIVC